MNNELNARLIEAATRMIDYLDRDYEITQKHESENASRIVWLVAISGFVLVNLPNLKGNSIPSTYYLPWITTAILGVVTHWLYRSVNAKDVRLYITKREQFMVYILSGSENATLDTLNKIQTNQTEELRAAAKALSRTTKLTWILETATITLLVISFGLIFLWFLHY